MINIYTSVSVSISHSIWISSVENYCWKMPPWTDWMFHPQDSPGRSHQWLGSWELDDDDRCWLDQFPRSVLASPGGREGPGLSAGSLEGLVVCSSPSGYKLGIGWRLYWDNNPPGQTVSSPELKRIIFCTNLSFFVLSPFQDKLSCLMFDYIFIFILFSHSHSLAKVHTCSHKVTATIGQTGPI